QGARPRRARSRGRAGGRQGIRRARQLGLSVASRARRGGGVHSEWPWSVFFRRYCRWERVYILSDSALYPCAIVRSADQKNSARIQRDHTAISSKIFEDIAAYKIPSDRGS